MFHWQRIFNLVIIYKNGVTREFEVTEYQVSPDSINWTSEDPFNRPLHLNYDEVTAVWIRGSRRRLKCSFFR